MILAGLAGGAAGAACRAAPAPPRRPAACVPLDAYGAAFLRGVTGAATSPSEWAADGRARSGLPLTTPDRVAYVTDDGVCRRVARAVAAAAAAGPTPSPRAPSGRVRVIRVADMYVAEDPGLATPSGRRQGFVFTAALALRYRVWM